MLFKVLLFSALSLANLTSVTIHAGSGPIASYETTVVHEGGSFTRSDGKRLPSDAIGALLEALGRPPIQEFDFSRTGLTIKDLVLNLPTTEGYLGDAAAIPQVRSRFEAQYFDFSAFERWVWEDRSSCTAGTMLDYYPRLTVDVAFSDGRDISIHSESTNPYMLPLQISNGVTTVDDCDPGLSLAIAHLMPEEAPVRASLSAETNVVNYGYEIAGSRAVKAAIERYGMTVGELEQTAQLLGLSVDYTGGTRKPPEWDGVVYMRDMPQVQFSLPSRSTAAQVRDALTQIKNELGNIRKMRWLQAALRTGAQIRVRVGDSGPYRDGYAEELVDAGHAASALLIMRTDRTSAPPLMSISDEHGRLLSSWFLLDDGDAMLYDFDAGRKPFAFSKAWYARIPQARSSSGYQISGVIVHRDGQSQTPQIP